MFPKISPTWIRQVKMISRMREGLGTLRPVVLVSGFKWNELQKTAYPQNTSKIHELSNLVHKETHSKTYCKGTMYIDTIQQATNHNVSIHAWGRKIHRWRLNWKRLGKTVEEPLQRLAWVDNSVAIPDLLLMLPFADTSDGALFSHFFVGNLVCWLKVGNLKEFNSISALQWTVEDMCSRSLTWNTSWNHEVERMQDLG